MSRTFKYSNYHTSFLNSSNGITQLKMLEYFGYKVDQECYAKVTEYGNGVIVSYTDKIQIQSQQYYTVCKDYVKLLVSRDGKKFRRGFVIPIVASWKMTTSQERIAKRLYFAGIVLLLEQFGYKQRSYSLIPDQGEVIHWYDDGTYALTLKSKKEITAYCHNFTQQLKWFDLNQHVCEDVIYNNSLISLLHGTHKDYLRLNLIQPKDYHGRNNNTPLY